MMKIDTRDFSLAAYQGLEAVKTKVRNTDDCKKASGVVQSLPSYISTWGLHRLAGDGVKFNGTARSAETRYKGIVYQQFLETLQSLTSVEFTPNEPQTLLIDMKLNDFTGLNKLAIALAYEWSFWAVPILGEAKE